LAGQILDAFEGDLPLCWTVSKADLAAVPGVGKQRLERLWAALSPNPHAPDDTPTDKKKGKAA
jgi:hypothetical protein